MTPLLGIGVCVSIQFGALQSTKRYFAQQNLASGVGGVGGENLTASQLLAAGAVAGVANAFVSGPVEHIRIRGYNRADALVMRLMVWLGMQTQPADAPLYKGPWSCIKTIYGSHGLKGIFKGQNATFLREGIGYGSYFWCYETLMQREIQRKGIKREEVSPLWAVAFGAAAGYAVRDCIVEL